MVNDAKAALSALAMEYLARASVAVPFLISLGFALAAITLTLIERFGSVTAYWVMAGGLAVVGVLAAALVSAKEQQEEIAEKQAEETDTGAVATDALAQAVTQAPLALLGSLLSSPGAPNMAFLVARALGRNWALVLLLAAIAALFWPSASASAAGAETTDEVETPVAAAEMTTDAGTQTMPSDLRP